jgi:hypothetical protein
LNDILEGVQTFFHTKSNLVDGVVTSSSSSSSTHRNDKSRHDKNCHYTGTTTSIPSHRHNDHKAFDHGNKKVNGKTKNDRINPVVFMTLLHTVLKAKDGATLKNDIQPLLVKKPMNEMTNDSNDNNNGSDVYDNDPYFTRDDYDALDPSTDDDSDINDANDGHVNQMRNDHQHDDVDNTFDSETMYTIMKEMDEELAQNHNLSRSMDDHGIGNDGVNNKQQISSHDLHLLSNLLKSMNSSHGCPGPVHSLLTEAGIVNKEWLHQFPSNLNDDDDDDDDDDDS